VAEFVLDFLWCVMCERDIFGVDPEQEQKGILISVGSRRERRIFYTKTHTPRVCCETTHTLKHARRERERERERERGNDDADDGAYYYYYYFCSFR